MLCEFQVCSKVIQLRTLYIRFFRFSIIGYYPTLKIFPCALQQGLVICCVYNNMYRLTPTSQIEVYVCERCLSYL